MARILYIEDDLTIQRTMMRAFKRRWPEYLIDGAVDAPTAIMLLKTVAYTAVISDFNLEVGTGGDVLTWISLHQPWLFKRFLFLTSDMFHTEALHVPVLEKPCSVIEVQRALGDLLAVKESAS